TLDSCSGNACGWLDEGGGTGGRGKRSSGRMMVEYNERTTFLPSFLCPWSFRSQRTEQLLLCCGRHTECACYFSWPPPPSLSPLPSSPLATRKSSRSRPAAASWPQAFQASPTASSHRDLTRKSASVPSSSSGTPPPESD